MNVNIASEFPQIDRVCRYYGVDPYFVAAIRLAESGGEGRQFGILSVPAPTYEDQLTICAKSVRNRLAEFAGNPLAVVVDEKGEKRLCYSSQFITTFARRWAPGDVDNDPDGLNKNWYSNCWSYYQRFTKRGGVL